MYTVFFFFSSRRRHTRSLCDWSSDVCSSDLLPQMSLDEALETTKIHSVAGVLPVGESLVARRPFRAPHHTISDAGLIGGGSYPRPGEVSLAHGGVLFRDELPEFRKNVLEVLRQPMEDGVATI